MSKEQKDILPVAIPGYALTQKNKAYPWHQPPLNTTIEDANKYANMKITEPDTLKYIQGFLAQGMPAEALGEIITKDLAFDGAFNFDIAELMKPLVTLQLVQIGAYSGIDVNIGDTIAIDQVDLDLQNKKNVDEEAKKAYQTRVKNIQDNMDKDIKVKEDVIEKEPVKGLMSKSSSVKENLEEDIEDLIEEKE